MILFVLGYGYGHPGAFNPFLLNSGWLDAAYLNYAWADYFRVPQPGSLVKGKQCSKNSSACHLITIKSCYFVKFGLPVFLKS